MIRKATLHDINDLVKIENLCFDTDRISKRNFRYLISKANAEIIVENANHSIKGYALLLFNSGTSLARLYSMAVHPEYQGHGVGEHLMQEVEKTAIDKDCPYVRLEVRTDNEPAKKLYRKFGYNTIGIIPEYYEDMMDAAKYEKYLPSNLNPTLTGVTYYKQTLDFTCGPSSLMMAMHTLDPSIKLDRKTELRVWREATTIFMNSGLGGCGPYGLALAAYNRGFGVEMYLKEYINNFMIDSVRSKEKKEVIRLVQQDFKEQISTLNIPVYNRVLSAAELENKIKSAGIPIVLVSSYRIYREKSPHWVVITGFDDKYIYCHDPYFAYNEKYPIDCINMPILKKEFEKMARYGKSANKATLIITKKG